MIVCVAIISSSAVGQVISGKVVDAETKDPLSYVHIGIQGKSMGVISRDDGAFSIDISRANADDTLVFQMIGFHDAIYPVKSLNSNKSHQIKLKPRVYKLKEVVVTADRIKDKKKPVKLGRHVPTKWTTGQSGYKDFGFGGENGLKIYHEEKKWYLTEMTMHIKVNTVDSILFRFNIYKIEGGLPGESFLKQEVFIKAYKKDKWISADLSTLNLVMEEDLFATYEVVRVWFSDKTNNAMFFTHGGGYERGGSLYRESSIAPWSTESYSHQLQVSNPVIFFSAFELKE